MTPVRTALVSPFTLTHIAAIQEASDEIGEKLTLSRVDVRDVYFTTALQVGAEKLELTTSSESDELPDGDFLRERVRAHIGREWAESFSLVRALFRTHGLISDSEPKSTLQQFALFCFLTDLLYALARGTALVTHESWDKLRSEANTLPIAMRLPVSNLLDLADPIQVKTVMPRMELLKSDIAKFRDIVESSSFASYVCAHDGLEQRDVSLSDSLAVLNHSTSVLMRGSSSLLKAADVAASVIAPVASVVKEVLSPLAGTAVEKAAEAARAAYDSKRRLVIYSVSSLAKIVIESRLAEFK